MALYEAIEPRSVHLAQDWLLAFGSLNTREAYRRDLAQFCNWLAEHSGSTVDLFDVDRPTVDLYARWLTEVRTLKPATVARKLASLSSLYDYAVAERRLTHSPLAHTRRPRVSADGTTRALTVDELASLLKAARGAGDRDFAFVSTLAVTGIRVSEAVGLQIQQVRPQGRHRVVPVTRKGGKAEEVPLPQQTSAALDQITGGRITGPVFLDSAGRPLDRHDAARLLRRLARAAGIADPKSVTPHVMRATYATALLRAGVASYRVQRALGHAHLATTERYMRAAEGLDDHANYAMAALLDGSSEALSH